MAKLISIKNPSKVLNIHFKNGSHIQINPDANSTSPPARVSNASLLRYGEIFRKFYLLSKLCRWAGSSVYRPAGKEESMLVIKSACEIEHIRLFKRDKPGDPGSVVYQMDRDIARGLRQYRKMNRLMHPIVWSISGCGAKKEKKGN